MRLALALWAAQFVCGAGASLLWGFVTADHVLLSSSAKYAQQTVCLSTDFPWLRKVNDHTVVGLCGDNSDCEYVMTEVESTCRLHELSFSALSTSSIAALCKKIVKTNLRKHQLKVNLLIGGYCKDKRRPILYRLDEMASMKEVDRAVHGQELPFVLALLDRLNEEWKIKNSEGLRGIRSTEEMQAVVEQCWGSIRKRCTKDYHHSEACAVGVAGARFMRFSNAGA